MANPSLIFLLYRQMRGDPARVLGFVYDQDEAARECKKCAVEMIDGRAGYAMHLICEGPAKEELGGHGAFWSVNKISDTEVGNYGCTYYKKVARYNSA